MKTCSACHQNKPLEHFRRDPRYRLGVTGQCKLCRNSAIALHAAKVKLLPKPETGTKRCTSCEESKPLQSFSRHATALDGHKARCKECVRRNVGAALYRLEPTRALRNRLYGYSMSLADFYAMIDAQRGLCACCDRPFSRPFIDHDHASGVVRGLLCARCNNWLAAVESPGFVDQARAYIARSAANPPRFRMRASHYLARKRQKEREQVLRSA